MDDEQPKYKFTSNDWFRVKGRGIVYIINEYLPNDLYDPRQLHNVLVQVDDKIGRVVGVESFAIGGISHDHPYKLHFGLIIK